VKLVSAVVIIVVLGRRLGRVPGDDEINAGLPVLDRLADREGGRDRLVQRIAHPHVAAPELHAVGAVQPAPQAPRLGDRLGAREAVAVAVPGIEAALVDAIDRDADLGDVHGRDREADGLAARQDEALARQRHHGGTGAQRHVDLLLAGKRGPAPGREALQQGHRIVLAVGQAADAEAVVDHVQRRFHVGRDAHVVAVLHRVAGRERHVEVEAGLAIGMAAVDAGAAVGERLAGRRRRLRQGDGRAVVAVCGRGRGGRGRRLGCRRGDRRGRSLDRLRGIADQISGDAGAQHERHDKCGKRRTRHGALPPQVACEQYGPDCVETVERGKAVVNKVGLWRGGHAC
jgi:hypothetical protein